MIHVNSINRSNAFDIVFVRQKYSTVQGKSKVTQTNGGGRRKFIFEEMFFHHSRNIDQKSTLVHSVESVAPTVVDCRPSPLNEQVGRDLLDWLSRVEQVSG